MDNQQEGKETKEAVAGGGKKNLHSAGLIPGTRNVISAFIELCPLKHSQPAISEVWLF